MKLKLIVAGLIVGFGFLLQGCELPKEGAKIVINGNGDNQINTGDHITDNDERTDTDENSNASKFNLEQEHYEKIFQAELAALTNSVEQQ